MLYSLNDDVTRECPKGPKKVIISERISVGLPIVGSDISGSVRLTQRIDDVVAMRVLYISLSKETPMSVANGSLLVLRSNKLGSKLAQNPFQFALSTNVSASTGIAFSDVIGVSVSIVANEDHTFSFEEVNQKMYFTRAMAIEDFDWVVSVANGSFNIATAFALEIVVEFYTLCKCRG